MNVFILDLQYLSDHHRNLRQTLRQPTPDFGQFTREDNGEHIIRGSYGTNKNSMAVQMAARKQRRLIENDVTDAPLQWLYAIIIVMLMCYGGNIL